VGKKEGRRLSCCVDHPKARLFLIRTTVGIKGGTRGETLSLAICFKIVQEGADFSAHLGEVGERLNVELHNVPGGRERKMEGKQ
jgi:hypothetical protein